MSPVSLDDVRELILDALNLREDKKKEDMDADLPLFGDGGLQLDSLDALQLAVAIEERWGLSVNPESGATVFRSIRTIAEHVNGARPE